MKKFTIPFFALLFAMAFMTSCGGGGNADAEKFCDCFAKFEAGDEEACEEEMEQLEEDMKKDEARYNSFKEAAMAKCPKAEKYINRMN